MVRNHLQLGSDRIAAILVAVVALGCGRTSDSLPPVPTTYQHDFAFLRAYKDLSGERHKRYDAVSLVGLPPDQRWEFEWREHPSGRIARSTNNLGLSETEPTSINHDGLRILIAGDSHTEGVVWNNESFPNVLERVAVERGLAGIEALNAGVGYMGPYCYVGVLRKYLALRPDVFVMTVFCGNDFMDDLRVAYIKGAFQEPSVSEDYYAPLRQAEQAWPAPCWQGVNQIYRFTRFPEEVGRALDAVENSIRVARDVCEQNRIGFVVVLLPTKIDVDVRDQREALWALAQHLGLSVDEISMNEQLGRRLNAKLDEAGVACLNVIDQFRQESQSLYWMQDHHLNVLGHRRLASLLLDKLQELGAVPNR